MTRDANSFFTWDAHACFPLGPNGDMSGLQRYRKAGASFVSVNVGMDMTPLPEIIRTIAGFRHWISQHSDQFLLATRTSDVTLARESGRLAVGFDLEGSVMLQEDPAMIGLFAQLGVRQILLAYNRNNQAAGGCHDKEQGLTSLGRCFVQEINRQGILMDCSHTSRSTSLEVMEMSTRPVIFSHSNPFALHGHPRNIDDEQIRACAGTNGVIGLSGVDIFFPAQSNDLVSGLLDQIDYVADLVGPRHIGLGLDYVFPEDEDLFGDSELSEEDKLWWPEGMGYDWENVRFMPPESLPRIAEGLALRNYSDEDIALIMGLNFKRAATHTWDHSPATAL